MSPQRFVSGTRFFTEAFVITAILIGASVMIGYIHNIGLSPWWLLLAAPFYFGFGCAALMLTGSVMVEKGE
ncbi:hypothetical protein ACQQ32_005642 [Pseudomonas aeruginosa]|nr:hypothetical protein [Pseudomonas aeruginosa]